MFMNFIRKKDADQLCDTSEYQIRMKCFFVLSATPGNTQIVLQVIDGLLYNRTYTIGVIPFRSTPDCSGHGTEILFRVDIDHTSAHGIRTGRSAMADPAVFSVRAFIPGCIRTDELLTMDPIPEKIGAVSFFFHREVRMFGTAGDTIFIYGSFTVFQGRAAVKRDVGF